MARDISPIVKESRREGYALHSKAPKILVKKSGIPGQHAHDRQGKASLYLTQLREKQKVKRIYGLLEKQFSRVMADASRMAGLPGENLLRLLEIRLDNVVYRAGFASSRRAARQLVSHGHFMLNGRRVNIPSQRVKINDLIVVRPKSSKNNYFTQLDTTKNSVKPLSWLNVDNQKFEIKIVGVPKRDEAESDIHEQLIVEYYSR